MSETTSKQRRRPSRARSRSSRDKNEDNDTAEGVLEHAEGMLGDASDTVEHLQRVRHDWEQRVRSAAKHSPYLTLAGAAGAGFVLGGGLSIALTRRLWLIGGRIAISLALQQLTQGSLFSSSSDES